MSNSMIGEVCLGSNGRLEDSSISDASFTCSSDLRMRFKHTGAKTLSGTYKDITILVSGEVTRISAKLLPENNESLIDSLARIYLKHGVIGQNEIDGYFTIVLYDGADKKLMLVQDRYTCYHQLYWFRGGRRLYFSSSLKQLVGHLDTPALKINEDALYQYLKFSYISPPFTIYKDISQLEIGQTIIADTRNGEFESSTVNWRSPAQRIANREEALENYRSLLLTSIERLYRQHGPCAFFLSGGFDSSINVALAAGRIKEPLHTIGIGSDERFNTDAPYAR